MATESMFDAPSLWWVIGTSEINFLLLPSALHQQCCKECCLMQHGSSMTWTAWQNCLDTVFKLKKIAFSHFCLFDLFCFLLYQLLREIWLCFHSVDFSAGAGLCSTNLTASGLKLCSGSMSPSLASTTHQVRGSRELAMVEEQRRPCRLLPGPMARSKMFAQLLSGITYFVLVFLHSISHCFPHWATLGFYVPSTLQTLLPADMHWYLLPSSPVTWLVCVLHHSAQVLYTLFKCRLLMSFGGLKD